MRDIRSPKRGSGRGFIGSRFFFMTDLSEGEKSDNNEGDDGTLGLFLTRETEGNDPDL